MLRGASQCVLIKEGQDIGLSRVCSEEFTGSHVPRICYGHQ